jgi:hypothetical protein
VAPAAAQPWVAWRPGFLFFVSPLVERITLTQSQLNSAVALATGEDPETISRLGFSLADPDSVQYDPEPCDIGPQMIDWDELDTQRYHCFR